MSVPLTINGVTFQYPQEFDTHWGPTLTNWSSAVTTGMLQTSGVNAATLIKSATANPALSGWLELAKTDTIAWRNNANSADLALGINGSNQLTFNGTPIGAAASLTNNNIFVGNASNQPTDVALSGDATIVASGALTIANGAVTNAKIVASAGITLTKLAALTASELVVSDGSGFLASLASPSLTEIGYVAGVTSSIQNQLNSISSSLGNYLPLAGGTMSGAINMASHKLTNVTQGTSSGEAVAVPADTAQIASNAVTQSVVSNSSTLFSVGTSVTTASITTTGGSVLLIGQATLQCTRTSGILSPAVALVLSNTGGTVLSNSYFAMNASFWANGNIVTVSLPIAYIETPSSGAQTYTLSYVFSAGTVVIETYNLSAVELKR